MLRIMLANPRYQHATNHMRQTTFLPSLSPVTQETIVGFDGLDFLERELLKESGV